MGVWDSISVKNNVPCVSFTHIVHVALTYEWNTGLSIWTLLLSSVPYFLKSFSFSVLRLISLFL